MSDEVEVYKVDCPPPCDLDPSYYGEWPPEDKSFECGICGVPWEDMIVTPLVARERDPHSDTGEGDG